MGCFLTTTDKDLAQMKQQMRKQARTVRHTSTPSAMEKARQTTQEFKTAKGISGSEEVVLDNPRSFGRFAHEAYQLSAFYHFDDVDNEVPVVVTKPDGTRVQGYIDTLINDKVIVDYKTNNMRDWSESRARREAKEYGRQVQEYVEADGAPPGCRGWIIATVPPNTSEIAEVYADELKEFGVGVKFCRGESAEDVIRAVEEAIRESK